jgi:hypothetical protein
MHMSIYTSFPCLSKPYIILPCPTRTKIEEYDLQLIIVQVCFVVAYPTGLIPSPKGHATSFSFGTPKFDREIRISRKDNAVTDSKIRINS